MFTAVCILLFLALYLVINKLIKSTKLIPTLSIFTFTLLVSLFFYPHASFCSDSQSERIISFHSDITINKDSSLTVEETIKVHSNGENIKYGIYRDFPTEYRSKQGKRFSVGYHILDAEKDGQPENYQIVDSGKDKRVYIGKTTTFLTPGEYTYKLKYNTTRQIGYYNDHDELYWNVTGNSWGFVIENVSATVKLPPGITTDTISIDGFTGAQGATTKNFSSSLENENQVEFSTTKPLNINEGFSIVVGWSKGFVNRPLSVKIQLYLESHKVLLTEIIGGIIILAVLCLILFRSKFRKLRK